MIYLLAALLPPLGLLLNGQPFSAVFNLVLIVFCLILGLFFHVLLLVPSAHALIAVHMKREERRHREVVDASAARPAAGLSRAETGPSGRRVDEKAVHGALIRSRHHAIDHRQPHRWASIRRRSTRLRRRRRSSLEDRGRWPPEGVGDGAGTSESIREAYTFDDVLLKPGLSDVLPSDVDIRSRVTRAIPLNIPIIASAMDTVTEARMAIAMAQAGGIGVIHRNFDPDAQAAQVRQVKKFESGMVVNPLTIGPDATLSDALALMKDHGISGIPVVTGAARASPASWSASSPTATCALPPIPGRRSPS